MYGFRFAASASFFVIIVIIASALFFAVVMVVVTMLTFAVIMEMHDMVVGMHMSVTFLTGAPEKPACLVGSKVGNDIKAILELECYPRDMMCLEYAQHHFPVYRQRDVNLCPFHYGRPVLISDSVSEFECDTYDRVVVLVGDSLEVDDEYRTEFETKYDRFSRLGIIFYYVAVHDMGMACESHGVFRAADSLPKEARLLGSPLIKIYFVDFKAVETLMPFGRGLDIADDFCVDFHSSVLFYSFRWMEIKLPLILAADFLR